MFMHSSTEQLAMTEIALDEEQNTEIIIIEKRTLGTWRFKTENNWR